MFRFGITYVHWNVQDKSRIGMEEKRIFDLVLVKFGRFLVNSGNILVKSGRFLVFFGIDVDCPTLFRTARAWRFNGLGCRNRGGFGRA